MPLLSNSLLLTQLWLKLDRLLDNKSLENLENSFKLVRIFIMMNLFNGIKLQTLESLTLMLFTERLTLEMVTRPVDGLIHLVGLILELMMIKL